MKKEILQKVRGLSDKDLAVIVDEFDNCHCYRIGEKEIKACEFQAIRKKLGLGKCGAYGILERMKQGRKIYYKGGDTAFVAKLAKLSKK